MCKFFIFLAFTCSLFADSFDHIKHESNRIGYIYIGDHQNQINQGTWIYIKNALDYYKEQKVDFIILELDTPGGEVFSAQKISDALKAIDIQNDIPVVAFINNWAISAGAMLAYSCRYITVVKDGSMGAAEPVSGGEKSSEKVNSAIRTDFAGRALFFDRNPLIAEAMVDATMLLVYREGQVVALHDNAEIKTTDIIITQKDKLLTLNAEEMITFKVANALLLPAKLVPITAGEKEAGSWPASKELLMTHPFFKQFADSEIISYKMNLRTRFFTILSHPVVTSLLLLALMFCFYIELHTPGFGAAGAMGLFALFLLILSSFATQAASVLELVLLLAGIGLILLEIFVIPGFGITGILGIILAGGALVALVLPSIKDVSFNFDTKTFNAAGLYFIKRLAWLAATFLLGVVAILCSGRFISRKLALFSPLVLRGEQEKEEGFIASGFEKEYIGKRGVAFTDLKPAGHIMIEKKQVQALSETGYITKGAEVEVTAGEGGHLIVKRVEEKNDLS